MGFGVLLALFVLFLLAGAIVAFLDRGKIGELQNQVDALKNRLEQQSATIRKLQSNDASPQMAPASDPIKATPKVASTVESPATKPDSAPAMQAKADADFSPAPPSPKQKSTTRSFDVEQFLRKNGLLWLGGVVLAIGGIFLARYAIEAGLLPPVVRVLMGAAFGVALVVTAEYLSRHKIRFHIQSPYVCAALASGGVITCFAIVQVAFDYYQFISPQLAFGLLAIVAFASTSLSLRFGPLLACIG